MPWEKDFDIENAVRDATRIFWSKGYAATSISDLTKGMRINKGSLYNAFGSKKELFIKAILQYASEHHQKAMRKLEMMDDPLDSIQVLFESLVAESLTDDEKRGCFLVNTALELPAHDEDINELVTSQLREMETFLENRIIAGQEKGSVSKSLDSKTAAKSLLSQVVGLRVLSRGVFTHDSLNAIKKQAIASIAA